MSLYVEMFYYGGFVYIDTEYTTSSIVNGGSGTDPPLRAVLDPVAAPTIVSEIHTAVPEPHTPWEPF